MEYAKVEADMKTKHIAEWQEKKSKKASGGLSFGSLVGLSSVSPRSLLISPIPRSPPI